MNKSKLPIRDELKRRWNDPIISERMREGSKKSIDKKMKERVMGLELVLEAGRFLQNRTFVKARQLARELNITPHKAGKILRNLGWVVWGSKTCTNKTFKRPEK